MPTVRLVTTIHAPIEQCFDLARSVDAHRESVAQTRERAIAGVTSGLLVLGDAVTWEAIHFGVRQRLTVQITEFDPPHHFIDALVKGPFRALRHVHEFTPDGDATRMVDLFSFEVPGGIAGRLVTALILTRYMRTFLYKRNLYLKSVAEANQAKEREQEPHGHC